LTYYRRHKRYTALLMALIGLVTCGLYLMVALTWAVFVEPTRSNRLFLSRYSIVMPGHGVEQNAAIAAQVRAHPAVAQVVPTIFGQGISLPEAIGGGTNWFNLFGLRQEDLPFVLERNNARLVAGQLIEPRTNGILLSEQVAASLGLEVGDVIHNAVDAEHYSNIVDPLEVVGILESDVRLGILSFEYMESHEVYHILPVRYLVAAREGQEGVLDVYLRSQVQGPRTTVWTLNKLNQEMAQEYAATLVLLIPITLVAALAMSLAVGVVNRLAYARRLSEFGILYAAGRGKRWLTRRLTLEVGGLALIGWILGIGISWLALAVLKLTLFEPRGHDLRAITAAPGALVALVPLAVFGFTRVSVGRVLARLDAVAVVERGERGLEKDVRPQKRQRQQSSVRAPRPLAALTFFERHRRQGITITGTMTLMTLAVVLAAFVFSAANDAGLARLGDLERMSVVATGLGSQLDPALIAEVRTHPSVERAMPFVQMTILSVLIPPFGGATINPYALYADDMTAVVELYGLELKEGHLPRPGTNELVLPETVAQNRRLQVGDVIGDPEHPAYPGAMDLPTEFVISGILARSPDVENWLSFLSLEYLQDHEAYPGLGGSVTRLLVVPKPGRKAAMDGWLENELASAQASAFTYRQAVAQARQERRTQMLTIALIESVVAVVAALTLAVLNYITISLRRAEYGVLHALGYGRLRLVWRAVQETALTTGAAWALSAALCLGGLLYLRFGLFGPLGLRLNLFNPGPWSLTGPIPIAVLATTSATIVRTLSSLDAVSILEGRQRA
jgi:ABC-type lipoprotein release transport system permease subunit